MLWAIIHLAKYCNRTMNTFKRKKSNDKNKVDQLAQEIFNRINKRDFIYIIKATSNSYTSGLYKIENTLIKYSNDTVEISKEFSPTIQETLKNVGLFIIYPNQQNKLETKVIKFYNPELFTEDLFELTIFQEFGFRPKESERQGILEQSIKKEKIKKTLVYACFENNSEKILELVKNTKKYQLDKKLEYTGTPLGLCVQNENIECFKEIAKAGATVSKKSLAFTPLNLAFKYSTEIVEYIHLEYPNIFEKEIKKKKFYIALECRDSKILNLLKNYGLDLNNYDPTFPYIHSFTDMNNITGIEFCLSNGLEINMKDKQGRTALDKAILRNNKEAINYLRKLGGKESK